MARKYSRIIFLFVLYILSAHLTLAHAEVVINEFSPSSDEEWVELFNTAGTDVDLTNWSLTDNSQPAATLSGTILANDYFIYQRSEGWLNNSGGDSLTLRDNTGAVKDTISYGSGGSVAGIPSADHSIARIPNGSGNWQNNISWTKGNPNPSPTTIPILTNTPIPTNTPVPTNITTPTIRPTATKTPTPKISKSPTPEPTDEEVDESSILGTQVTPSPMANSGASNAASLPVVITLSLIGAGLGLISFLLIWKKRNALRLPKLLSDNKLSDETH